MFLQSTISENFIFFWGKIFFSPFFASVSTWKRGDMFYIFLKSFIFVGNRLKCVACRIVVHEACANVLNTKFTCRQSFCESVRKYREFTTVPHHWVQRKQLKVIFCSRKLNVAQWHQALKKIYIY